MMPAVAADTRPHIDVSGVNQQPAYPATAYATSERGAVVMGVAVTAGGKVSKVRLLKTSSFNDIDGAAIAAVMGWKFIPATHDGANVEGVSVVRLEFQPPDPPPAAGAAPAASVKVPEPADVLPASLELEADRAKFEVVRKPIPCANGRIDVTLQFQHINGRAALGADGGSLAFASLDVLSGNDTASVEMADEEVYSPPIEDFGFERTFAKGSDPSWEKYSYFGLFGTPQTVSIYWNAYGLVVARLGIHETHQTQLPAQPTEFRLRVSSVAAKFIEPELICLPDANIP
jgi:TonB family protein